MRLSYNPVARYRWPWTWTDYDNVWILKARDVRKGRSTLVLAEPQPANYNMLMYVMKT